LTNHNFVEPGQGHSGDDATRAVWLTKLQDRVTHYLEDFTSMIIPRWLVAIPIMVVASFGSSSAWGSAVLDRAGMFSRDAVQKANTQLEQLERATKIPVVIETISEVPGLDKNASPEQRREAISALAVKRDNALKDEGVYYLISKNDHLNSNILVRERFAAVLPRAKRDSIGHAFLAEFKKNDFDGGLLHGVQAIERALEGATVGHHAATAPGGIEPRHQPAGAARARGGQSTMGTFLLIILGIFGVLLVVRLLGGLFNRSAGAGYPGQMGMQRPGMGPGGGPGYYGGPGYGGRGGGFFSGMLGGLGGALAGNWLYDQFSGRHGGMSSADAIHSADYTSGTPDGGDAIVGADDGGGGGGDWGGDGGAADTGGGDWGGGGGDWGGGGGDWGGGGGDWGGGGGGDW
jgi:uncharacterized membrane protein YeaQ/YmgE (transglycosylase-associated protein family)